MRWEASSTARLVAPAALFGSKDAELQGRLQIVKRLSLLLLCSPVDTFATHMPVLQQRLMDLLAFAGPVAYVEACSGAARLCSFRRRP